MNTNDIKANNIYPNYSALCEALKIIPKNNGDSKVAQLKEIERYVKYSKQGHKFIIEKIYTKPLPKTENKRNLSPYIQYMELLLLQYLQTQPSGELSISTSKLATKLMMVHQNYMDYHNNKKELAELLNVELIHIHDFMSTTSSAYKNAIKTILSRLEKRSVILYESRWKTVKKELEHGINGSVKEKTIIKFATPEQKKEIIKIRYETLNFHGGNLQEIYKSGKANEYYTDLDNRYKIYMDLDKVYKTHEITINENIIENEYYKSLQDLMSNNSSNSSLQNLANSIWANSNLDRMKNKVKSAKLASKKRALGEDDTPPTPFELERLNDGFLDIMKIINKALITNGVRRG